MIISLEKKIEEKYEINELKRCLEYFKKYKKMLSDMDELNDVLIESIVDVTKSKGEFNIFQLALIIKAQEDFTKVAKDMIKVFDEVGIIKYIE